MPESLSHMAKGVEKPKKTEKSQAELRVILEQRLSSLKPLLQEGVKEYNQALKDDLFEDQADEPEGAGESRKQEMQKKLTVLINQAEKLKTKLDSQEPLEQTSPSLSSPSSRPDGSKETITLSLEQELQNHLSFYQKVNLDLPPDFEDSARDIWDRNQAEIKQEMEQRGFDALLIIPGGIPLKTLAEKMKMENGYYFYQVKEDFSDITSQNTDKPRIILYHKATLPEVQKKTGLDVHLNITGKEVKELFTQNPNLYMSTLEDFIVMEKKNHEETGQHLSDYTKKSAQWLPGSKAGARLVYSYWGPGVRKLDVDGRDDEYRADDLGVRPSRCFF